MDGVEFISTERKRQIEVEGWKPEHDDMWSNCELTQVAALYALDESSRTIYDSDGNGIGLVPYLYPRGRWGMQWWKPAKDDSFGGRIHELAKAGALIAAEIDRLLRLRARMGGE